MAKKVDNIYAMAGRDLSVKLLCIMPSKLCEQILSPLTGLPRRELPTIELLIESHFVGWFIN